MEALFENSIAAIPAQRAWRWCVDGLRLWRRYPLRLFVLSFMPLLLEFALQAIPLVGVTLSKIFPVMLGFGVLRGLAHAHESDVLAWSSPLAAWRAADRWSALALAAMTGLSVCAVQQGAAAALFGWQSVDAVLLGHMKAHADLLTRFFSCALILPGVPVAVLLGLSPMLLMFTAASPWRACRQSIGIVCRHPAPFLLFTLIQMGLFAVMLAIPFGLLLVLPLTPWLSACWYAIWTDLVMWDGNLTP